jgi:peroxiredoxin Q/BCP
MSLQPGVAIPPFALPDEQGATVQPADFLGRWWVLYSYPKDNTPGCTQEARDFSCLADEFAALGAPVLGLSPDKAPSHLKFIAGQGLSLRLLSDPDHQVLEALGAWGRKKFMGREYDGVKRSTWLVDPQGRVAALWTDVKVKDHAREVLDTLRRLKG